MKSWVKKLFAFILVWILFFSLIPGGGLQVNAEDDSGDGSMREIFQQADDNDDAFAAEDGHSLRTSGSKPAYFDLRRENYVTPVRQQNPYGSCWGFGAIAAAESSILSSGLENDPNRLNLSEKQVAWFVTKEINEPSNKQNGEGLVAASGTSDADRYDLGGFTLYATNLFASGSGPISESTSTEDGEIYRYRGKNGSVVNGRVSWYDSNDELQTGYRKKYYSPDDDWSIPDQYRFRQDYRLKESYLLPSPSVPVAEDSVQTTYHEEGTEAIKDQLLHKRAVCISVYAVHSRPGEGSSSQTEDLFAQYTTGTKNNHVVTVVGYDDNFPISKFPGTKKPPHKGAWLVKNSWGSDTCDFPDNGYSHWGLLEGQDRPGSDYHAVSNKHTGYYWLSYYDTSISAPEAYSFEKKASEDYFLHQHDYLPIMEYKEYATSSVIKMANVFTEDKNRKIEDISFFTATPGTTVTYKIILLQKGWNNPETDGECVYTSSPKTYTYGGYHRETLNTDPDIIVSRKQDYAVVIEEKTPSGKYSISFGKSKNERMGSFHFHSVINKKESFVFMDNSWQDLSSKSVQTTLLGGGDPWVMDNFPIKTGLSPVANQDLYLEIHYKSDENPDTLKAGQTSHFEISFVGGTEDLTFTPKVTWTSSDPEILKVNPTNSDNSEADITGIKAGTANIIVDAGIYGKRILRIKVFDLSITNIYLGNDVLTRTYTGNPIIPEIKDVSGEVSDSSESKWGLVKDKDYTVSCTNNVNCGKAYIKAKGIGTYSGSAESWFVILPAKAKIKKLTPGENKITVSFESQKASGISGYLISYKETGSKTFKTMKVGSDKTSAEITGLTAGKTYEVSLKAYVTIDEESLLIDKTNYTMRPEKENVDYFGEESDRVISGKVTEKQEAASSQKKPADKSADSASVEKTEKAIQSIKKDGDVSKSVFQPFIFQPKEVYKTKIRLKWKKVSKADGYIIYGNQCGEKYRMKKLTELPASKTSWLCKNRKKGRYYKFLILAYQIKNNSKQVMKISRTIHVATSGGNVGNDKKVRLNKTKITIKKGKTSTLKATPVPASEKKKVWRHVGMRYESSNNKVAKVNRTGTITTIGKGTCNIYAYTQNGIYKRAEITVK